MMNNDVFKILEDIREQFIKELIDDDGNLTQLGWYCVLRGVSEEFRVQGDLK